MRDIWKCPLQRASYASSIGGGARLPTKGHVYLGNWKKTSEVLAQGKRSTRKSESPGALPVTLRIMFFRSRTNNFLLLNWSDELCHS